MSDGFLSCSEWAFRIVKNYLNPLQIQMYKYTSQKNLNSLNKPSASSIRNVMSPNLKPVNSFYPQSNKKSSNDQSEPKKQLKYFPSVKNIINNNTTALSPRLSYKVNLQQSGDQPSKVQPSTSIRQQYRSLRILLLMQGCRPRQPLFFYFDDQTLCFQLIRFLYEKITAKGISGPPQLFYYESGNFHLDYFMTLESAKVTDIPTNAITLRMKKMGPTSIGQNLKIFQIIKCIGSGGFSKVFLARAYGILMAIKVIPKKVIIDTGKQSIIQNEKFILQNCGHHPFVTKLYTSFETNKFIIFGMEYCNGGELFNLLRKVKRMSEEDARFYFLQTLSVISFLHSKRIVYRDLKPENIILDWEGHIRLADYGLSKIMSEERTYSFCGSAQYMAPEMLLKKGHSYEVDYYCLGALVYQLITGLPPYYSRDQNQLFCNIMTKELNFPENIPMSDSLKVFLTRLLSKNTEQRFNNVEQMFTYEWLNGCNMKDIMAKKLKPPYKTENFFYNFDDTEFADDQELQMRRLQLEKETSHCNNPMNQNFSYESQQIIKISEAINKDQGQQSFLKKGDKEKDQRFQSLATSESSKVNVNPNSAASGKFPISSFIKKHSVKDTSPAANRKFETNRGNGIQSPKSSNLVQNANTSTEGQKNLNGKGLLSSVKSIDFLKHQQYQPTYIGVKSPKNDQKKQLSNLNFIEVANLPSHQTNRNLYFNQSPRISYEINNSNNGYNKNITNSQTLYQKPANFKPNDDPIREDQQPQQRFFKLRANKNPAMDRYLKTSPDRSRDKSPNNARSSVQMKKLYAMGSNGFRGSYQGQSPKNVYIQNPQRHIK